MVGMSTPSGCTVSAAPLATIPVADWERLLAMNPATSAFSQRAVHDAWWSGYGDGAEDISLVVRNGAAAICGYLPLMRRPDGVRYLGATFHIDYATVLLDLSPSGCAREAAEALVAALYADPSPLDLRRLRRADPAHSLLLDALTASPANAPDTARAATVSVEEPAPSIDLHGITSLDAHLERIDKIWILQKVGRRHVCDMWLMWRRRWKRWATPTPCMAFQATDATTWNSMWPRNSARRSARVPGPPWRPCNRAAPPAWALPSGMHSPAWAHSPHA